MCLVAEDKTEGLRGLWLLDKQNVTFNAPSAKLGRTGPQLYPSIQGCQA